MIWVPTGYVAAISITAQLDMSMLRSSFLRSLCHFTFLHAPSNMRVKNAVAFRAVLDVCDCVGNHLNENWMDVLKCVSLWELLYQHHSGTPTDASLFAPVSEVDGGTEGLCSSCFLGMFRILPGLVCWWWAGDRVVFATFRSLSGLLSPYLRCTVCCDVCTGAGFLTVVLVE